MATLKQIEANRLNAKKSTGPRSAERKAASSMNALKSGIDAQSQIIRGEDPASLEALAAEYTGRFQPATPEERFYVDTLVRDDWQLRRLARADAQIWESGFSSTFRLEEDTALGQVFNNRSQTFMRLQRRIDATERSYQRALRELQRLRAGREASTPASDPAALPQPAENQTPFSQIGFVPPPQPVAHALVRAASPLLATQGEAVLPAPQSSPQSPRLTLAAVDPVRALRAE
jgi:hypothetical protein